MRSILYFSPVPIQVADVVQEPLVVEKGLPREPIEVVWIRKTLHKLHFDLKSQPFPLRTCLILGARIASHLCVPAHLQALFLFSSLLLFPFTLSNEFLKKISIFDDNEGRKEEKEEKEGRKEEKEEKVARMASFAERGSELFMDDDFEGAVEAFTQALEDPSAAELSKAKVAALHAKRSIAYAKLEEWPSSLEDATKATEFDPSNAKAFLRKGVAAFELEEFEVARSAFEEAKTLSKNPSSKAVKDIEAWLRKCDAELDDEESDEDGGDDDEAQKVNDEAGKSAKDDAPKAMERESEREREREREIVCVSPLRCNCQVIDEVSE